MHQLNIGVGWSAMRLRFIPRTSDSKLWDRLDQHTIVLSEKIRDYYNTMAEKEGLDPYVISYYLQELPFTENASVEAIDGLTLKDTYGSFFRKKQYHEVAMIYESGEPIKCSKQSCRNQYSISEALEDKDGILALYSTPACVAIKKGINGGRYISWIMNLLAGEHEVNYIDKNIISNDQTYGCLKKYYIPRLKRGCIANIHTQKDDLREDRIRELMELAQDGGISVHIYLYIDMHDRYITTYDKEIEIGFGLGFLYDNDKVIKNTKVKVFPKKEDGGYLEYEKELAGTFVEKYC